MNKVILITGASKGIGKAICKLLAENNYTVIANYNKSYSEIKALQDELNKKNINIDIFKSDVSNPKEVKEMIKFVIEKYKKIDVLINNAGISSFGLFTDISDNDWNNVINTNLYSAFCVTREVVPNMIHRKTGLIINISSVWGLVGSSCETLYSISKAGLDAMTKSLAKELGPSNIRVNSIAPGLIDTQMNQNLTSDALKELIQEIPLQKIGLPLDIAKCAHWLIEDNFTTGQIISVNGGWVIN